MHMARSSSRSRSRRSCRGWTRRWMRRCRAMSSSPPPPSSRTVTSSTGRRGPRPTRSTAFGCRGPVAPSIFVHRCRLKAGLRFFHMSHRQDHSLRALRLLHSGFKARYGIWYGQPAEDTSEFVRDFCSFMPQLGYAGWRNPWVSPIAGRERRMCRQRAQSAWRSWRSRASTNYQ